MTAADGADGIAWLTAALREGTSSFFFLSTTCLERNEEKDTEPLPQASPLSLPQLSMMSPAWPSNFPYQFLEGLRPRTSLAGSLTIFHSALPPCLSSLPFPCSSKPLQPHQDTWSLPPDPVQHPLPHTVDVDAIAGGCWPTFLLHGRNGHNCLVSQPQGHRHKILPACGGTLVGGRHCHLSSQGHPSATGPMVGFSACLLSLLPFIPCNHHHSSLLIMPSNADFLKPLLLRS